MTREERGRPKAKSEVAFYGKVLAFAVKHYNGKMRKDGRTPHLVHALRVVEILRRLASVEDDRILAAALLHDLLEEEPRLQYDDVKRLCGTKVADWVASLTEDRRLPKKNRKRRMLRTFSALSSEAKLVKLADRLDNVRDPWLRAHRSVWVRYTRECRRMLEDAAGVSPPLESALRAALAAGKNRTR